MITEIKEFFKDSYATDIFYGYLQHKNVDYKTKQKNS